MSGVIARALAMIAVAFQNFYDLLPESTTPVIGGFSSCDNAGHHLAGLVLARGGSKGIPKKNLEEIGGQPLVGISLNAMIESGVFKSIWVSTDDPDISSWVKETYSKQTVSVHTRAPYTATDSASSMIAVLEFLGYHPEIDALGLVQATSPFVRPEYLKTAAEMLSQGTYESVFSVTRSHSLRWSVVNNNEEATEPLNFNPKLRPRRQDWNGEMIENGMFYFAVRSVIVNYQVFQNEKSGYVEIPKHLSMEIDTLEDLEVARCFATKLKERTSSSA